MIDKAKFNKILVFLISTLFIANLFAFPNIKSDNGLKDTLLFLVGFLFMFCFSLLLALNPDKYDAFLDRINIMGFPKYPKDKEKRLKFMKYFFYSGVIFLSICILLLLLTIIMHLSSRLWTTILT